VTQKIDTSARDLSNDRDPVIGADHDNLQEYFDGSIDDVRIYWKALTKAEVRDLYLGLL